MNSDPFLRHCCITFFIFQDIFQTVFRFLDLKSGLAFWLYVDHEITVLLVSVTLLNILVATISGGV